MAALRLGYLGPPGTFSAQALAESTAGTDAAEAEQVAFATIHDTIMAAQRGEVDAALVPIENSVEGAVNVTLDAMATDAPDLRIGGEYVLRIELALVAATSAPDLAELRVVRSHPHATAQCAGYLRDVLPAARVLPAASTAEAVRDVEPGEAAIGTLLASSLYDRVVLARAIQDERDHETRFVWLARDPGVAPGAAGAGARKTSVLFAGAGDDAPGWLVRCLSEFAFRGVNLTKIESRPLRRRLGHYRFLVDAQGSDQDAPVAEAIAALRGQCEEVRVLGSYRAHAR